ncbi:MAG TPA: Holliday junction resolvase RuvX [Fibrobacteraceae bacterium]|nr:Holliday junction resolvase RuvX [Fibrobacteraceae bacterium]
MQRSRYLAIDYGDRRVGIAVADGDVPIAFPRETIDRQKTPLWDRLLQIIATEHATELVVGWPAHPDGRPDGKQVDVQRFVEDLRQRTPLPIHLQDEAYSSMAALQATAHLKRKDKRDKGRVDRAAATIILQTWLDQREGK